MFDVCIEIPSLPDPLELVLPGGISLKHTNLEALVQPALAPLGPAFKLLDAVMALVKVLTALQGALTSVPPDFAAAAQALGRVAAVPASLASLAPPVAVPMLILGCIDLVLRTLTQVRSELLHLQQQLLGLGNVERVAHRLGDTRLLHVFECAKHNIGQEAANLGKGMASVGHLLGIIQMLSNLAGLSLAVPHLDALTGRPLDQALAPLDGLIETLRALRQAVPLP